LAKELYILSGLGADERVFQRLNFEEFSITYIKWIVPLNNETIENYAKRLIEQIITSKPILIGLSFGGLIAIEIAKQIETQKVILISSAKTYKEIPIYFRIAGQIGIHKLLSSQILKSTNFVTNWFFGVNSKIDKQILKDVINDTDPTFLKWAIDKAVRWNNHTQIQNLFHIHGKSDKILPSRFVSCNQIINSGGHLMVLDKHEELNIILQNQLKRITK